MDDLHRKHEEQLNTPSDAEFTVEDIVREFGTASQTAPEPEMPEEEETLKIWTPKPKQAPPPMPEDEPEDAPEEESEDEPLEEAPEEEVRRPRLLQMEEKPLPSLYDTPEDAAYEYAHSCRKLRPAAIISWVLMVLSAAVALIMSNPRWGLDAFVPMPLANAGTLAILLGHSILALPVLRKGVESLLRGKFTAATMLCILVLITAVRGFMTLGSERLSLCAAASGVLTVSLWGEYLLASAKLRSLKTAMAMEDPVAVVHLPSLWNEKDCLHRGPADLDGFVADLEQIPVSGKVINIISAILTAASLAVAAVLAAKADRDFLWAANVLLLGACPLGSMLAYGRGFCLISRRLKTAGAAIRGWAGARRMSGNVGVILTDTDIFPAANVSLNGIKVYGEESADRLLGYAAAILERSGAKYVARLFSQALEAQNGRHYKLDNFRTYEAGGLGGEIGSDVVLLGGLGFMQTMGVRIPDDARPKQAMYIALGGRVAGVFVLNYKASDAVRSGLSALLSSRGVATILATGDTLLTPGMVRMKYSLPADRLEYPVSRERAALAAADGVGEQGAVLARGGFLSFAMAVCSGRQLRRGVRAAAAITAMGAVIGFFLMCLLTLIGAYDTVGALNLLLYHAIWLIPTGLVSGMVGKS